MTSLPSLRPIYAFHLWTCSSSCGAVRAGGHSGCACRGISPQPDGHPARCRSIRWTPTFKTQGTARLPNSPESPLHRYAGDHDGHRRIQQSTASKPNRKQLVARKFLSIWDRGHTPSRLARSLGALAPSVEPKSPRMVQTRTSRVLVDRQVNEVTLFRDAKSAGTKSGSAEDWREPIVLLGGNQGEGTALGTG